MTEEQVTKKILEWLQQDEWDIVCYDFPQSGTGVFLHPNGTTSKNKNSVNPDIVAVKNGICVFFEDKSFYCSADFDKVSRLRSTGIYSEAINELVMGYDVKKFYYGVGYPEVVHKTSELNKVDFVVGVGEQGEIRVLHEIAEIF